MWPQYQIDNPVYSSDVKRDYLREAYGVRCPPEAGDCFDSKGQYTGGRGEGFTGAVTIDPALEKYCSDNCSRMLIGDPNNAREYAVWVSEIRHNCRHPSYDSLGPDRIWDARMGRCRNMTTEEASVVSDWDRRQEEQAAEVREEDARKVLVTLGINLALVNKLKTNRGNPMTGDEARRRLANLEARTSFTQPSDLMAALQEYAPIYERRGIPYPVGSGTTAARRQAGQRRYHSLGDWERRYLEGDWYVLGALDPRKVKQVGVGGFYGFVQQWVRPSLQEMQLRVAG